VDTIPTNKLGVYVVRSVSDVFVKAGSEFRLSDAHRSSHCKSEGELVPNRVEMMNQGVPEVKRGNQGLPGEDRGVWAVLTPGSPGDQDSGEDREPHYCLVEIINTSASPIEIGKNEKLGEGEPLDLRDDEVVGNMVFSVSETHDRSSAPPELEKGMSKLEHLVKAERTR
jgi:hypothetical protein